jgi:hypothetical protein
MGTQDVFLNMAGGIKVEDPAIDLAVCTSIVSSFEERPVSEKTCFAAEIGLGGELPLGSSYEPSELSKPTWKSVIQRGPNPWAAQDRRHRRAKQFFASILSRLMQLHRVSDLDANALTSPLLMQMHLCASIAI